MEIQITKSFAAEGFKGIELVCGKTTAEVTLTTYGVIVLCKNASHRAWRGMGKTFNDFDVALSAYKSSAMKTIIETARHELTPA